MTDNTDQVEIIATCTKLSPLELRAIRANRLYRFLLEQIQKNRDIDDNFIWKLVKTTFDHYNEEIRKAAFYLALVDLNRKGIWV